MEENDFAPHIHDAMRQVRALKRRVLAAEMFTGYSGRARAVGGTAALLAAAIMSRPFYPKTETAHLVGWGAVLAIAVIASYSALLRWFLLRPKGHREIARLMPTVDALPPLAVGGLLSAALLSAGSHDILFGTWMCLFGLANLSSRRVLPRGIWPVGLFYIGCGAVCLFAPGVSFMNPWPMGVVFFVGEWAGGFVFHYNRKPEGTISSFFGVGQAAEEPHEPKD